ncbi:MAG: AAA family ATPase [Bacillota bacterium]|nr:AAA family ATPase [Bacillota bacterium]
MAELPASVRLPAELVLTLKKVNPWWEGKPGPRIPAFRRWPFGRLLSLLERGLTPAVVLRGPRRVGKTVLVRQIIEDLLARGVPAECLFYLPFDELEALRGLGEPILSVAYWFEENVLGRSFNESAREGRPAYLFFDEVQNLDNWAPQIKHLVDNHTVRALITGSSSLRIEAGRDSLAGRITTVEMGPLLLREIAGLRFGFSEPPLWGDNGLDHLLAPDFWHSARQKAYRDAEIRWKAFQVFSERGGYPEASEKADLPWSEVADYLNETVIKRAIKHDLRLGARGQKRDEKLLEEVFRLACRYAGQVAGQSVFVPEIHQALGGNVGWRRILNYLGFLDGTLLLRLIKPHEIRLKRRKSPDKICLCDHALRASWLQEVIPIDPEGLVNNPHLSDLAGHLAESTVGYFLSSVPNLDVSYFPMRGAEPEVDFILTVGTRRIPIEVKYRRRIDPHEDTRGLRAFLEKTIYNAPFGLLITLDDGVQIPDPRIIPLSLSALLWLR